MIKYYGQFKNPSVDEYLHKEFFINKREGFFIECGASNGIADSSCKFFEEFMGWSGVNIEAHPGTFKLLLENRPDSLNLNLALTSSEEEGKILKFNAYDFPKNSSNIRQFGPHAPIGYLDSAKEQRGDTKVINLEEKGQLEVKGTTYKKVIEDNNITFVDIFVLDVEGSELNVIDGMRGCKVLPMVFCIETNKIDKNKLESNLSLLGYKHHSDIYVNSFYILQ